MSPTRTSPKAVTPSSVKVLMIVEAGIIGFLSFWVLSEYAYNAYFRSYADQILLTHVTTYSAVLGLGIGLAGSAVAAMLYKNLQRAKYRLETVVAPKIRGAVDKLLPSVTGMDAASQAVATTEAVIVQSQAQSGSPQVTAIVPVPEEDEPKKGSD